MKLINSFFLSLLCIIAATSCNSGSNTDNTNAADTATADSTGSGSVDGFKLGVQMWTFRMFSVTDALNKVDSAGIKNIEAFFG